MEISELFGQPAHPLLVHVPVVLIPLAALGAVACAISRRLRDRIGWFVVAIAAVGLVGARLAEVSGEPLEESVRETALVERHAELGEALFAVAVLLFVAQVAMVAWSTWQRRQAGRAERAMPGLSDEPSRQPEGGGTAVLTRPAEAAPVTRADEAAQGPRWVAPLLAVLVVASSVFATVQVVEVGHSGAEAVWHDTQVEEEG